MKAPNGIFQVSFGHLSPRFSRDPLILFSHNELKHKWQVGLLSYDQELGYVKIPRRDGVPTHAEIQEAEAVIVRRIFDTYVKEDMTVRQIAKQLTLNRIPTSTNAGQWSWSAVDRILHEEAYIGTYYYNRKQCVPIEGAYGKKRQRFKCTLRPKEEWIPISVPPTARLDTLQHCKPRLFYLPADQSPRWDYPRPSYSPIVMI